MQLPARRGVCLFTGNKYGEDVLERCVSFYVRPVLCHVLCLFAFTVGHNGSFSLLSFILIQVEDDDCLRLNVASRIELNLDIYSTVAGSKSRLPVCMAPMKTTTAPCRWAFGAGVNCITGGALLVHFHNALYSLLLSRRELVSD